jgi:ribosomal protein S27AE
MTALTNRLERRAFELLDGGNEAGPTWRWFCGRCAARPAIAGALPPGRRVCPACGFGLLLRAMSDEVPRSDEPYLIVDASFAVQALSERGEDYLEISEREALNRHVTQLLIPADRSAGGSANLAVALSKAVRGEGPPDQVTVSRANTFGERARARISACGPPHAALVVLD